MLCGVFAFFALHHAQAAPVRIANAYTTVDVDPSAASITGWTSCLMACDVPGPTTYSQSLVDARSPISFVPLSGSSQSAWKLVSATPTEIALGRVDDPAASLVFALVGRHELAVTSRGVPISATVGRADYFKDPAKQRPGERKGTTAITWVDNAGVYLIDPLAVVPRPSSPSVSEWIGYKSGYWTLMLNGLGAISVPPNGTRSDGFSEGFQADVTAAAILRIYGGPLTPSALREAEKDLEHLMFDGLWSWLRYICFFLLGVLNFIYAKIGSWGLSIIALACIVKVTMIPLNNIASRMQSQVNEVQSKLHPIIQSIKSKYSGEEQANRILEAHKQMGVTPFYSLKAFSGLMILIPVLLASFNTLNEAAGLNGAPFLFVRDLARPDGLIPLPMTLPLLGDSLNLLPFVMTAVTLLASRSFKDPSLLPELQRAQQKRLYFMALLFLVIFYSFPAGMVIYWTVSNLLQFARDLVNSQLRTRKDVPA